MKQKITRPVSIRIKYTRYVIPILLITFLSIGAIDTIFYFHSVKESSEHEQTAYSNNAAHITGILFFSVYLRFQYLFL
mgnify:CR=1 FL=1